MDLDRLHRCFDQTVPRTRAMGRTFAGMVETAQHADFGARSVLYICATHAQAMNSIDQFLRVCELLDLPASQVEGDTVEVTGDDGSAMTVRFACGETRAVGYRAVFFDHYSQREDS